MKFTHRTIEDQLVKGAKNFPALILTGPRRAGKTTLLKKLFKKASYYLLEDPDIIARVSADPRSFLEEIKFPVILDEIQNTPELFNYIRTIIDSKPGVRGKWILTGSQESSLMQRVSESMAGRACIFNLLPFSSAESERVSILNGGFPEVLSNPADRGVWFRSYIQTYLERDVRAISSIKNLSTFRRFLSLLATRCGTILNKTDIAAPLGVSVPTLTEWINILEITHQIILVPPFYENFGKRLIKSPKLYFVDSGLLCYILGIEKEAALRTSPFYGPIFEGFAASEIVKHQINHGKRKEIYYFRDQQGLEVDFIVPSGNNVLTALEVKATRSIRPEMCEPMNKLSKNVKKYTLKKAIVALADTKDKDRIGAVSPGVKLFTVRDIPNEF